MEHCERPRRRAHAAVSAQLFHVHAKLDCGAARREHFCLSQPERLQRLSSGDEELYADEVYAQDLFRDRVFHLEARVGLNKGVATIGALRGVGVDEELNRPHAPVIEALGDPHSIVREARAQLRGQAGRGCNFHKFLVSPLDRTVALPEVADRPCAVANDLDLDVAGARHPLLHVDFAVPKGPQRFRLTAPVSRIEFSGA